MMLSCTPQEEVTWGHEITFLVFVPFFAAQWHSSLPSASPPAGLSTAPVASSLHPLGQATNTNKKTNSKHKQTSQE